MRLQPQQRIAQRPVLVFVAGAVTGGIVAGRMGRHAIGEEFDEGRTVVGAGAIGGPAGDRMDGKKIIAVDPDAGNAEADGARGEGCFLAAGDTLA